jgi:hypothetical protein
VFKSPPPNKIIRPENHPIPSSKHRHDNWHTHYKCGAQSNLTTYSNRNPCQGIVNPIMVQPPSDILPFGGAMGLDGWRWARVMLALLATCAWLAVPFFVAFGFLSARTHCGPPVWVLWTWICAASASSVSVFSLSLSSSPMSILVTFTLQTFLDFGFPSTTRVLVSSVISAH